MKFLVRAVGGVVVGGAALLLSVAPAGAATLWKHNNFSGESVSVEASADLGGFKNEASSVQTGRVQTYFDDVNFRGWSFTSGDSMNCLGCVNYNIPVPGLNWGDRIDSVR